MVWGWEDQWRELLAARGYKLRSATFDPAYGWTILFEAGGVTHEFERRTTVGVRERIEQLPILAAEPKEVTS